MSNRQITYLPPKLLLAYPQNARTHSDRQISQIAESIRRLGLITPIIVDEGRVIMGGEGRWQASLKLR